MRVGVKHWALLYVDEKARGAQGIPSKEYAPLSLHLIVGKRRDHPPVEDSLGWQVGGEVFTNSTAVVGSRRARGIVELTVRQLVKM